MVAVPRIIGARCPTVLVAAIIPIIAVDSWLYGPISLSVLSSRSVVSTLRIKRRLGGKAGYVHLIHLLSDGFASTIVVG